MKVSDTEDQTGCHWEGWVIGEMEERRDSIDLGLFGQPLQLIGEGAQRERGLLTHRASVQFADVHEAVVPVGGGS